MAQGIFIGLALVSVLTLLFARWQQHAAAHHLATDGDADDSAESEANLGLWRRHFFLGMAMADALACLGLLYFLISSRMWPLLVAGVGAYVGYAICYPGRVRPTE